MHARRRALVFHIEPLMRNVIFWLALAVTGCRAASAGFASEDVLPTLSEAELEQARRLLPPPELNFPAGRRTLELQGDAKALFQQLGRSCSLEAVFDGQYQPGPPVRLRIVEADCREALRQLEVVTASFVVPLGEHVLLVANDTPPKRAELEPTMALMIPVPQSLSAQELQETARAVQQAMDIVRLGFDTQRRLLVLRDKVSKVRAAELLFEQLLQHRGQVAVELEMIEVSRRATLSYGLAWPGEFPFYNFMRIGPAIGMLPAARLSGVLFGGGKSLFGIGVGKAELLASLTESFGRLLLKAQLHSLAGQPASFHVGDQYPIMTAGYFGYTGGLPVYAPAPTMQFADLGAVVKFTPFIHGRDEVTLELEAEFKLLTGESVNGIPLLSNRRLASRVRLKEGEWAVVAGLLNSAEARTITGVAGLARLPLIGPLFRQQTVSKDSSEVLILLKPRVLALPPSEMVAREIFVGSESRVRSPL